MTQYIKRVTVVEAVQYDGTNQDEVSAFAKKISKHLSIKDAGRGVLGLEDTTSDKTWANINFIWVMDYLVKDENNQWIIMPPTHFEKLYEKRDG